MVESFINIDISEIPIGIPILIKQKNGKVFIGVRQSNGEFCGTAIGYYEHNQLHLFNGNIIDNVSQWTSIIISKKEV